MRGGYGLRAAAATLMHHLDEVGSELRRLGLSRWERVVESLALVLDLSLIWL